MRPRAPAARCWETMNEICVTRGKQSRLVDLLASCPSDRYQCTGKHPTHRFGATHDTLVRQSRGGRKTCKHEHEGRVVPTPNTQGRGGGVTKIAKPEISPIQEGEAKIKPVISLKSKVDPIQLNTNPQPNSYTHTWKRLSSCFDVLACSSSTLESLSDPIPRPDLYVGGACLLCSTALSLDAPPLPSNQLPPFIVNRHTGVTLVPLPAKQTRQPWFAGS